MRIPDFIEIPLHIKPMGQVIDYWHELIGSLQKETTGKKAAIFILDTAGEWDHTDLGNEGNKYKGNSTPDPSRDARGHGHLCAGVAAAKDNGFGCRGVAPDALVIPRKGLRDSGTGYDNEIAAEIHKIVDLFNSQLKGKYIPILSMSFGGGRPSSAMNEALDRAEQAGFALIAAAGNNNGPVIYPASKENVIAVPAFDSMDRRANFSNYGPQTDIAAYGVSVYTTNNRGGYSSASGTSFSCPMVAGAAGLVADKFFDEFVKAGAKTNELMRGHLKNFARDVLEKGEDDFSGAGIVNVPNLLANTPVFSDEPDEPEPPRSVREISVPVKQDMQIIWGPGFYPSDLGTMSKSKMEVQQRRVLKVKEALIGTKEGLSYNTLHDKVLRETVKFFHNRGLVLSQGSDSWDAARWTAHFMQLIIDDTIPTYKVLKLVCEDEEGREVIYS